MYRGIEYDRKDLVAAVTTAVLLAVVVVAWQLAVRSRSSAQVAARNEVTELRQKAEAVAKYDDNALIEAEQKAAAWQERLLPAGAVEEIVQSLGAGWRYEPGATKAHAGGVERHGVLRFLSDSVADWPRIVDAVGKLEARASVGVQEIDIRTRGDDSRRNFESVKLEIVFLTKE